MNHPARAAMLLSELNPPKCLKCRRKANADGFCWWHLPKRVRRIDSGKATP